MAKYVCSVCGYTAEGEAPETCPVCGAVKEVFVKQEEGAKNYADEHRISIAKDVAFIVDCDVTAETLIKEIKKSGGKWLTDISIFDIYSGEKIGENQKQIAFTLNFSDPTKTLTDEEVMACFNTIIENVEKKCKAKLRNE